MHETSMENMGRFIVKYLGDEFVRDRQRVSVLDIGGRNIRGLNPPGYIDLLDSSKFQYRASNIEPGNGTDIVQLDPYRIPLADSSMDVVISGQVFEHVEFFWLLFAEIMRVVKDDGYVCIIAPSAGPVHFKIDCYRFYPDGFRALAKYANCNVVEIWQDNRSVWMDLVGVFTKFA